MWRSVRIRGPLQQSLVSATRVHIASMATLCEKGKEDKFYVSGEERSFSLTTGYNTRYVIKTTRKRKKSWWREQT